MNLIPFVRRETPAAALPRVGDDPGVKEAAATVRDLVAREHALTRRVEALRNGVPLADLLTLDKLQAERDGILVTPEDERRGAPSAKRIVALGAAIAKLRDQINRTALAHGRTRPNADAEAKRAQAERAAREMLGKPAEDDGVEDLAEMERELAVLCRAVELARQDEATARREALDRFRPIAQGRYRDVLGQLVEAVAAAGQLADELESVATTIREAAGTRDVVVQTVPFHALRLSQPSSRLNIWLDDVGRVHAVDVDCPRARRGHRMSQRAS